LLDDSEYYVTKGVLAVLY